MLISRKTALLSRPSNQIMRAAGRAASEEARRSVGAKIVRKQLDDIAYKFVPRTTDVSLQPMRLPYLSDKTAGILGLEVGQYVPALLIPAR